MKETNNKSKYKKKTSEVNKKKMKIQGKISLTITKFFMPFLPLSLEG